MQSSFEEKRQFLVDHPKYVLDHVSLRFPFSHQQLTKYRSILAWDLIVCNYNISWSTDMVDEFIDVLFPQDEPYWPESFSVNDTLPWDSIEFVKRYEHLWDWEYMAENDMLQGKCKEHFLSRLERCERYDPNPTTVDFDLDLDDPIAEKIMQLDNPVNPIVWKPEQLDEFYLNDTYDDELIHDKNIIWTLPFLKRYVQLFRVNHLYSNPNIWNSIFSEFDEEENLEGVLDSIDQ